MKSLIKAVAIAAVLGAPLVSYAQSNGPLTRDQVKSDLIQYEQAGGRVNLGNDPYYPGDAQGAMQRVAQQKGDTAAYGGAVVNSASGAPSRASLANPSGPTTMSNSLSLGH